MSVDPVSACTPAATSRASYDVENRIIAGACAAASAATAWAAWRPSESAKAGSSFANTVVAPKDPSAMAASVAPGPSAMASTVSPRERAFVSSSPALSACP